MKTNWCTGLAQRIFSTIPLAPHFVRWEHRPKLCVRRHAAVRLSRETAVAYLWLNFERWPVGFRFKWIMGCSSPSLGALTPMFYLYKMRPFSLGEQKREYPSYNFTLPIRTSTRHDAFLAANKVCKYTMSRKSLLADVFSPSLHTSLVSMVAKEKCSDALPWKEKSHCLELSAWGWEGGCGLI